MLHGIRLVFGVRAAVAATGATILFGCATAAQRQAQHIGSSIQEASTQMKACITSVFADSEGVEILAHVPPPGQQPTIMQMADASMPTFHEAQVVAALRSRSDVCRNQFIDKVSLVAPSLSSVMIDTTSKGDLDTLSLVKGQESWGDFVTRGKTISDEGREKLQAAAQQLGGELEASHERELEQRQAAFAATAQYLQNQQLLNSLNRPANTTCQRFGTIVQCSTY